MPNIRGVHKGYFEVLEFQIIIWKGTPTPPSRLNTPLEHFPGWFWAAYISKKFNYKNV
jgi:hypothetical protein